MKEWALLYSQHNIISFLLVPDAFVTWTTQFCSTENVSYKYHYISVLYLSKH